MPKINRGYQSLFEYLARKNILFTRWVEERFYPEKNNRLRETGRRRWNPHFYHGQQILGGLQPLVDIGKDFIDTFKPYKAGYHVKRDFLQPLRGAGNIAKGIANLTVGPCFFLVILSGMYFAHACMYPRQVLLKISRTI